MGYCHTPYFWDDAVPQPSLGQRNTPPQPRDRATPPAPEQRNPLSPRRSIRRTRARAGRRERAADSPRWRMRVAPSPPYRPAPQSRARTGWGRGSCGGVSRVGGVSRRGVCHRGAPCPWCGRRRRRRRLGCRRGGRSAARGRMDVMSPQQEHLGPGRSSSVSGESRVFAAADGKKVGLLLWKSWGKVSFPAAVLVTGRSPGPRRCGGSRRESWGRERPRESSVQACPGGRVLR